MISTLINALAVIGSLALIFGGVFLAYFSLRRVIRPAPADAARATLTEMSEWLPTNIREPNDHADAAEPQMDGRDIGY